ncbi:MAG TPA: [FeFe] hydrogenase, group A [Sedimentisphaerales bacterium]|nr:[FeFe] hydrogenase, group A [Sedimentisphaerales bacterium]
MNTEKFLTINGKQVEFNAERNLLEVIRKANIDLPTFCYHSDLSIYGSCRLCIVEIEGMGVVTSCSTTPKAGMIVKTHTDKLRKMRKIYLELLLANHHQGCTTCEKSDCCKLHDLARRMNVTAVRFKCAEETKAIDTSNECLVRDTNKCILCGDCVRACSEIQGIGAVDFAYRGAKATVIPAFGKDLSKVECVYCGLCASVCPTGAITPKNHIERVWSAINNENKKVVAQIAPAVRVALGEMFGLEAGTVTTGKIVAALKMIGFDKIYDTSFAADLTVIEETNEFIDRKTKKGKLPLFTSCCPAWVKFAEQYYSDLLENISSCRSPQQMFGSLAKETLPKSLGIDKENLYVVSIMPCTAKKFEAKRPEFSTDGNADVDVVLTTQELGKMIKQAGIQFNDLMPESLDMPLGFKTGAGVIFGASGGVSEAVLRYASEKLTGLKLESVDFKQVRGNKGILEKTVTIGDIELKLAIVHGLKNARAIAEKVRQGQCDYDFIEVMACPGGCIAGAGQPVSLECKTKQQRTNGLYDADKMLQLHKSQDNPYVLKCYKDELGEIGGHKAHELLHTSYQSRKRINNEGFSLLGGSGEERLQVSVCVGTSCYLKGSQKLLQKIMNYVREKELENAVDVRATFCFEKCDNGPNVKVGDKQISKCNLDTVCAEIAEQLKATV